MNLTEEYIDSIENATDSISVSTMIENFNNSITAVNYQFPPDTDLDLSEEENDSLIRMFKRLDSTVRTRLEQFAGKFQNDSTSIAAMADSVNLVNSVSGQATLPSRNQHN